MTTLKLFESNWSESFKENNILMSVKNFILVKIAKKLANLVSHKFNLFTF